MPGRPPREWFQRCAEDVAQSGAAVNPGAVCGATWKRKTPAQKRATLRAEETSMPKKAKKKKKSTHKRPKVSARKPKRKKAKKKGKHKHRCSHCGHSSSHGASGCTHASPSGLFCSCKHTGRG
jgi:hypothetical protein